MKTLFYFIVCAVMLLGCSKNEDADGGTSGSGGGGSSSLWESIREEYNINKPGLKGEGATYSYDTNTMYANGRIDGHLWIGGFDRKTKEQVFEWIDSEPLDSIVKQYVGYGNYVELYIYEFHLQSYVIKSNDTYCFLLYGNGGVNGYSSDLYFLNHTTKKIYRTITSAANPNYTYNVSNGIIPWFKGIVAEKRLFSNDKRYICYNMHGDSLFAPNFNFFNTSGINEVNKYDAINYKEGMRKLILDLANLELYRYNIETATKVWSNSQSPFENIGDRPRMNNYSITKDGNLWTYDVNYTNYDGTKGSLSFILNIDTGEYELK